LCPTNSFLSNHSWRTVIVVRDRFFMTVLLSSTRRTRPTTGPAMIATWTLGASVHGNNTTATAEGIITVMNTTRSVISVIVGLLWVIYMVCSISILKLTSNDTTNGVPTTTTALGAICILTTRMICGTILRRIIMPAVSPSRSVTIRHTYAPVLVLRSGGPETGNCQCRNRTYQRHHCEF
jgi:hypothetical protein